MGDLSLGRAAPLIAAVNKFVDAQAELVATLHRQFPIGAPVVWKRGKFTCVGTVVDHAYGDNLFAKNAKTMKRVRVGSFEIIAALTEKGE